MNESEINKLINSMTKKFQNGGFIDCLRNGGSVEKCKCGCDKIAKAEGFVCSDEEFEDAYKVAVEIMGPLKGLFE